ncbi:MAG: hypothetical protein E7490_06995 [Ruminococcaceae bacterium]|nr:hypothetical protein [Oscillospiraceae bacterium]
MELALKIFDKLRYFIIVLGAGFLVTAMITQYDWAYMGAVICIALFIACDATVMIIQRKLNIPVKKHENMFKLKKRK